MSSFLETKLEALLVTEGKIKEEKRVIQCELNRVQELNIEKMERFVMDNRSGIQQGMQNRCNAGAQGRAEQFTRCYCGARFETILEILKVQDKKIKELQLDRTINKT